jgi:hypothetical protein
VLPDLFQPTLDGPWIPGSGPNSIGPTPDEEAQRLLNEASRGPDATDIASEFDTPGPGGSQTPGGVAVQAPNEQNAGFILGDMPIPPGAGYLTFDYEYTGDSTGNQVASFWINDLVAWSTSTQTVNGPRRAYATVRHVSGGTSRLAFAVSRRAAGSNGTLSITNVRLIPQSAINIPRCDPIDFNNDGSLFDPTDIDAFLSVFSEGPCVPTTAICNDIDFNNDGSLFDPCDIDSFLLVFSEGPCTLCGL